MSSACRHPVVYHGLCASCGADLDKQAQTDAAAAAAAGTNSQGSGRAWARPATGRGGAASSSTSAPGQAIVLGGFHQTIHLSADALRETSRRNSAALLESRKLLCVLDLDHTLLHATSDPRVAPFVGREEDLFSFTLPAHGPTPPASAAAAPRLGGHRAPPPPAVPALKTHYVKLRPWLSHFLESAAALFDMHVYTMGARPYADAVVPLLDPTHALIKRRVVSRDETGGDATNPALAAGVAKSLKRMHPCDEGMIAIVDDRVDVWRDNSKNVVRAFEYLYFSGRGAEMNARPQSQAQARLQGQLGREGQQHRGPGGVGVVPDPIGEFPLLPPIRSKYSKPSSVAAAAASCGVMPLPSPTPTPSPPAPAVSAVAAPAVAAAAAPVAAAGSSSGGAGKLRRRKAAGGAPPPPAEMKGPTHVPYTSRAASSTASAGSASSAADLIVLDGSDDEKETSTQSSAVAAAPAAASTAAATPSASAASSSGVVRMDLDDDEVTDPGEEDPEAAALRALDAAIDLTDAQHDAITPARDDPAPRRPSRSPYDGDAASLPIFPYQFFDHPCPDNVLLSLSAVLEAVHTLFYEQIDQTRREQARLREAAMAVDEEKKAQDNDASGAAAAAAAPLSSQSGGVLEDLLPLTPQHSVPRLLSLLKRTTLSGCVIVFSGVFPTVKPGRDGRGPARGGSGAQRAEAWLAATAFGATCLEEFPEVEAQQRRQQMAGEEGGEEADAPVVPFGHSDLGSPANGESSASSSSPLRVTHVVAARDGSAKTHHAHSLPAPQRPFIVHVSWLWHSIAHFKRGDEAKFPLWPEHKQGQAAKTTKPVTSTATRDDASGAEAATATGPTVTPTAAPVSVPPTTATGAIAAAGAAAPALSNHSTAASTSALAPVDAAAAGAPVPGGAISPVANESVAPAAPANANAVTPPSATPAAATPAPTGAKTGTAPIRRRIPKKVPAATSVSASAPTSAAAPPAVSAPSPAAPSSPPASAAPASSAPPALPTPGTVGLHLVHHVPVPPTGAELVERVRALLRAEADEAARRRAAEEITQAEEMVKAARLSARLRRPTPGADDGAGAADSAAAAASSSSSSSSSRRSSHRKSVSFSGMELGPTNPRFTINTRSSGLGDEERDDRADAAALLSPSGSGLKRKSHGGVVPLDDAARSKKTAHHARSDLINLADDDDVDIGVTAAELYGDHGHGGADPSSGAQDAEEDDGFGELNEDLFDDEVDHSGDYEDQDRFDDDM